MLSYSFGQTALIGGLLIAITCALMSFFIVVRRLAFAGMGISHAAFGGVAIGIAAGVNPIVTAAGFCVLVAGGIGWFSRKGKLHEDTIIGILFSASMALGIVLIAAAHAYNQDLLSYLFGSILAVAWTDVLILAILTLLAVAFMLLFFKELLFFAFDEETATASGVPVRFVYYGLLVTIALTIVVSIKLVGIILVSALIVIPGATGLQLSRNYRRVIVFSILSAVISVVVGLQLSFSFNVASGATIVLVMFALFLIAVGISPRRSYMEALLSKRAKAKAQGSEVSQGEGSTLGPVDRAQPIETSLTVGDVETRVDD
jgi:zinc transport system permease protein